MNKNLTTLAFDAGLQPFNRVHVLSTPEVDVAEDIAAILGERNLYFTEAYRHRWGVQVHGYETSGERLILGAVESAKTPEGGRRFRAVIFRCDGHVVYQTPDTRSLDFAAACIDMRYWVRHIDESKVFNALCIQKMRDAGRATVAAERALSALASNKQSP